jgi:DNA-binding NarL/FixJ family response regulator
VTEPAVTRVLVVDDQELIRIGLTAIIAAQPDLEVAGEAADGEAAVRQTIATRPDVVLMDVRMPGVDGIEATRRISSGPDPAPAVLILTTFDIDAHVFAALRAGAAGFLVKDTPPEQLLDAIRVVAAGESLLTPSVTRRVIAEFTRLPSEAATTDEEALARVTPRERDVVALVARGLSNDEIAEQLFLSTATIKSHLGRATAKLGLTSRAQVVMWAYETGLVRPSQPG